MAKMLVDQFAEFSAMMMRCMPRTIDPLVAQRFISNPTALRELLNNALLPFGAAGRFNETSFTIEVDSTRGIKGLIEIAKFDSFDSEIYNWYPEGVRLSPDLRDENVYLVSLDMMVLDCGEVTDELDKLCLKPASVECLLAFGAQYPDMQRRYPILTISEYGREKVACLLMNENRRELHVVEDVEELIHNRRILAVSKTAADCSLE